MAIKAAAVLFLTAVGCVTASTAPTLAPTSAPTSVVSPTAAPTLVPTLPPTSAPTSAVVTPTPAPKVTAFASTVNLPANASASDFNQSHFLASIAAAAKVNAADVRIISVDFVVTVSYNFSNVVTHADVKKAVAANANVPESAVTVNITQNRRLAEADGRALQATGVTADVQIVTADAALADGAKTAAADATALAATLSTQTGQTIAAPVVATPPALGVIVQTEIVSTTGTAVPVPATSAIATEMQSRSGLTVTVQNKDLGIRDGGFTTTTAAPATVAPTPAPTPAPKNDEDETNDASKMVVTQTVAVALIGLLMAF